MSENVVVDNTNQKADINQKYFRAAFNSKREKEKVKQTQPKPPNKTNSARLV